MVLVNSGWHSGYGVALTVLSIGIRNVGAKFEAGYPEPVLLEEVCFFRLWLKCRYRSHGKSDRGLDYCSVTQAFHLLSVDSPNLSIRN